MIQDIAPMVLDNQYRNKKELRPDSILCVFSGKDVLASISGDTVSLPTAELLSGQTERTQYLFSIDGFTYFLAELKPDAVLPEGYSFLTVRGHRSLGPRHTVFAEMTAYHLYVWYRDNRYCGRCGTKTVHDAKLRMCSCPNCGNMIFPKICPAVIVGVTDGDRILLTKYAGRGFNHYALVAGFVEIGETGEDTVRREVMEEVGVRVRNIRYFNTQPWGVDSDFLVGYFCELDGDDSIHLDPEELSTAVWLHREELEVPQDQASLTNTMIRAFIENRMPAGGDARA